MSKYARKDSPATGSLSVIAAQIEAMLFLAASPVPESELKTALGVSGAEFKSAVAELEAHLSSGHGLVMRAVAGGWLLETNPHFAEVLSLFRDTAQRRHVRLSKPAVETLSVVAYNQPVTRGEVEDLRGVRSERVIETLLSHGLIRISGRKKALGSPLLYRTTPRFLEIFGLEAIADLPTLEELNELGANPEEISSEPEQETELPSAQAQTEYEDDAS